MTKYDPEKIEKKWREVWEKSGIYNTDLASKKPKHYNLVMFPYPSGSYLHMGHAYSYTGADIYARYKRLNNLNVFEPIGYDAFGLPAENFAIKNKKHPKESTDENVEHAEVQLKTFGCMFDWEKTVNTSSPEYYKWTQWLFLKLFEQGLAYQKEAPVNWCPECKTVLANEQVIEGLCERCDTKVVQKEMNQWFFKITDYAEKLIKDLDKVDWPESSIVKQRNWIGRSEGVLIKFQISNNKSQINSKNKISNEIEVFTTRVDTIFGCTYMVLAPEHPIVAELLKSKGKGSRIKNHKEVEKYIINSQKKSDIDRMSEDKEKTGVELKGIKAVNPFNGKEVPVWVADYVLYGYGTGAVMAVPAHDVRDFEFAKKFDLPIVQSVAPYNLDEKNPPREGKKNTVRRVAHIILENKKGEILTLNVKGEEWGKNKPKTLIIGGIESDESPEKTAIREVKEETGYTDVEVVKVHPIEFHAEFFASHKNLNRYVKTIGVFCKLKSEKSIPISEEEKKLHDIVWVKKELVPDTVTIPDDAFLSKVYVENKEAYTGEGVLIDSGDFTSLTSEEAKKEMAKWLEKKKLGKKKVNYRLHDWSIGRQRYWGAPIPIIYCHRCLEVKSNKLKVKSGEIRTTIIDGKEYAIVPVPEKNLPVELPDLDIKDVRPKGTGKGPLANVSSFVNTKCPKCGGKAERETDTMDTFVCSSFYFMRYPSVGDDKKMMDKSITEKWLPVDMYVGGAEHVTMHLLYARFITKALKDAGEIDFDEPFLSLRHQGMILGSDGKKMSKSKGNVVIPDKTIKEHGADVFRTYLLFMGPFDEGGPWNPKGMKGIKRFLDRVWSLSEEVVKATAPTSRQGESRAGVPTDSVGKIEEAALARITHKTIKKVTEDIEGFRFNTAISAMMECMNEYYKLKKEILFDKSSNAWRAALESFIILLSPFAPHISEEIWENMGFRESIFKATWPKYNKKLIKEETTVIPVQVNGKVRDEIMVAVDSTEAVVGKQALGSEKVKKYTSGKEIVKTVYVKGRLLSIVVK